MRLEGKVALITGGARGIGAAEASLFAREGASVVVSDVREDMGTSVAADITDEGGQAVFVRLDVSSPEEWKEAVDQTGRRFGKLDVLVNNASIYSTVPVETTPVPAVGRANGRQRPRGRFWARPVRYRRCGMPEAAP